MKNRNRTEIVSQILQSAMGDEGATKTQIMYNAFLSHTQLKGYLAILTENDLIRYEEDAFKFKTTEKGLRFLEIHNTLGVMIDGEEQGRQQQLRVQV